MILEEKELKKLIASYQKKSDEAYGNYQATGYSRYYTSHSKYDDMIDTLRVVLSYKDDTIQAKNLKAHITIWAGKIRDMPYMPLERKEEEITKILNEIMSVAAWL